MSDSVWVRFFQHCVTVYASDMIIISEKYSIWIDCQKCHLHIYVLRYFMPLWPWVLDCLCSLFLRVLGCLKIQINHFNANLSNFYFPYDQVYIFQQITVYHHFVFTHQYFIFIYFILFYWFMLHQVFINFPNLYY